MSEQTSPRAGGTNQLLVDLGPIAVFVIAYNLFQRLAVTRDNAVFIATGLFIAAVLAAIIYCQLTRGRIPPVLIVTGVLVTVFGGLTIALHDENFIKIKVTVVNAFYATAILGSLAFRQNVWKLLFQHAFTLPDRIWTILAMRWGGLFVFLALLNEVLRRSVTTETWVNLRVVPFVAVVAFALANTPLLLKHTPPENAPDTDENPPA